LYKEPRDFGGRELFLAEPHVKKREVWEKDSEVQGFQEKIRTTRAVHRGEARVRRNLNGGRQLSFTQLGYYARHLKSRGRLRGLE